MRTLSFLSYYKPFSRKHSYKQQAQTQTQTQTQTHPLTQTQPFGTISSSTSFTHNSWRFHPNTHEMRRVFDYYDANKDGKISLAEYKAALRATTGPRVDEAVARRMFDVADKDHDGFIDFDEFLGVNTAGGGVKMADIRSAFRVFDIDGDGRISAEEVAEVLKRIGGFEGCGVDACRRMVRGVDKDGDGLVDLEEFTSMMTRTMKLILD